MGVNIAWRSEAHAGENQSWLGSAHGTNECDSIQLDADKFLAAFPSGVVPSGVALGRVTATGLYVPYTDLETHGVGSGVAQGLLFTSANLKGTTAAAAQDVWAALYWHGSVLEANLPVGHGLDANGRADMKHIRFVA